MPFLNNRRANVSDFRSSDVPNQKSVTICHANLACPNHVRPRGCDGSDIWESDTQTRSARAHANSTGAMFFPSQCHARRTAEAAAAAAQSTDDKRTSSSSSVGTYAHAIYTCTCDNIYVHRRHSTGKKLALYVRIILDGQ